jgi:hypothetical protein
MGWLLEFIFYPIGEFLVQVLFDTFFYLFIPITEEDRKHFRYWEFAAALTIMILIMALTFLLIWWFAKISFW